MHSGVVPLNNSLSSMADCVGRYYVSAEESVVCKSKLGKTSFHITGNIKGKFKNLRKEQSLANA